MYQLPTEIILLINDHLSPTARFNLYQSFPKAREALKSKVFSTLEFTDFGRKKNLIRKGALSINRQGRNRFVNELENLKDVLEFVKNVKVYGDSSGNNKWELIIPYLHPEFKVHLIDRKLTLTHDWFLKSIGNERCYFEEVKLGPCAEDEHLPCIRSAKMTTDVLTQQSKNLDNLIQLDLQLSSTPVTRLPSSLEELSLSFGSNCALAGHHPITNTSVKKLVVHDGATLNTIAHCEFKNLEKLNITSDILKVDVKNLNYIMSNSAELSTLEVYLSSSATSTNLPFSLSISTLYYHADYTDIVQLVDYVDKLPNLRTLRLGYCDNLITIIYTIFERFKKLNIEISTDMAVHYNTMIPKNYSNCFINSTTVNNLKLVNRQNFLNTYAAFNAAC